MRYRKMYLGSRSFPKTVPTWLTTREGGRLSSWEMLEERLFGKPFPLDKGKLLHNHQDPSQLSLPEKACGHLHGPAWIQCPESDLPRFYSHYLLSCLFPNLRGQFLWDKNTFFHLFGHISHHNAWNWADTQKMSRGKRIGWSEEISDLGEEVNIYCLYISIQLKYVMTSWLYFLISNLFLPMSYQAEDPATKQQIKARKDKQTNKNIYMVQFYCCCLFCFLTPCPMVHLVVGMIFPTDWSIWESVGLNNWFWTDSASCVSIVISLSNTCWGIQTCKEIRTQFKISKYWNFVSITKLK